MNNKKNNIYRGIKYKNNLFKLLFDSFTPNNIAPKKNHHPLIFMFHSLIEKKRGMLVLLLFYKIWEKKYPVFIN